ncbi:MAG: VWA domain-containing protein, partial [Fimbriimonadaceae bacterium]|nr:VWA domain-containing protein [Fimbriimonadaceae bacterium]
GTRVIEAEIKRREEARRVYEAAKNAGQTASLLDQERPNIFTQSVANIMPGEKIKIVVSYVQVLKYEEGQFEFNFPMVVGPRYLGNAPDPGKIAPPIVPKGTRTGTNIDLTVNLDAGAPIQGFQSILHKVTVNRRGEEQAIIKLAKADEIPNRDFILRYRMATDSVQSAFLTHMGSKGGFFTLILMPPKAVQPAQIAPKEIIFVMDQSGSQNGFPIDKSKELTNKLIKTLRRNDTFNVLGFNTSVYKLWDAARPNTPANIAEAEAFVNKMTASGGTALDQGVLAALTARADPNRLRYVLFNTDGYAGNEAIILDSIQKNRDRARMFTFGIGNSVNRYLIDQMAYEGKGDAEYVTLAESADSAVARLVKRLETPVLTQINAHFSGVDVQDALPAAIPDVFSEKPVIITGRYSQAGRGQLVLTGNLGGKPWSKILNLDFPAQANAPALESIWARQRVDELTRRNFLASAYPAASRVANEDIIQLALEFKIMTQFTSFVAVEKKVVNIGGRQRTVAVPVEMADGVSYEGIFGNEKLADKAVSGLFRGGIPGGSAGSGGGGYGGGGFGGGGNGGRTAAGKTQTGQLPTSASFVTYDPADNSIVRVDDSKMKPEERRRYRYESRVQKDLRALKGKVEIEIWLKNLDAAVLEKFNKLGFKVDFSDEKLKVVMGVCDAKLLIELAQIDEVDRVRKLGGR